MIRAKFKLFGEFHVELSTGQHILLKGRKGPSIVTYLLLSNEHSDYRDKLVDLLWSRSSSESGRASLRQTLSELRRQFQAVGLDIVGSDPRSIDRIALASEQLSADVLDFQRFDQTKTVESSIEIANLYQGRLLDGFDTRDTDFMAWLNAHRRRFEERVIERLKHIVEVKFA